MAIRQNNHHWHVHHLINVSDSSSLFSNLISYLPKPGCILAGFDFPIGLPYSYARKAGLPDFLSALPKFGHEEWNQFYMPAETPSQISLHRPFYPNRPGESNRLHLEQGLDLSFNQLYRLCEIAHENRRSACPLFWTLGGQQVGKAAIDGWESLISPALENPALNISFWPFSGSLDYLCQPGNIVVVETYPAEFYSHLGLFPSSQRKSKRRYGDRRYYAEKLINWSEVLQLELDNSLLASIKDGFGDCPEGEDQFDALVGLYGMINVVLGNHPTGEPVPPQIGNIEGWIFGQAQP